CRRSPSCWCCCRGSPCAARSSIELDAGFLDGCVPQLGLVGQRRREFRRRQGPRLKPELAETRLRLRRLQSIAHGGIDLLDYVRRRLGGREQTDQQIGGNALEASFAQGGNVRQVGPALVAGDGERPQPAFLDVRKQHGLRRHADLRLVAQQVGEGRGGA